MRKHINNEQFEGPLENPSHASCPSANASIYKQAPLSWTICSRSLLHINIIGPYLPSPWDKPPIVFACYIGLILIKKTN